MNMSGVAKQEILYQLYNIVARTRKAHGVYHCLINTWLEKSAQFHADDMFYYNYCSHIDRLGRNYIERTSDISNKQINPSGEIIVKGPGGTHCVENVVDHWLNSPGHREILLDPRQRFMGAGFHLKEQKINGNYWVMIFAYDQRKMVCQDGLCSIQPANHNYIKRNV